MLLYHKRIVLSGGEEISNPVFEVEMSISEFIAKLIDIGSQFIWFVMLAVWGGTVNYLGQIKSDKDRRFSIIELLIEWVISAFAGLLVAYLCTEMDISWHLTAVLTAIAGHMGGRTLPVIEHLLSNKFGKRG